MHYLKVVRSLVLTLGIVAAAGCVASESADQPFSTQEITSFERPWALTFLPDGRMLVTEKAGRLLVVSSAGDQQEITGVPDVDYGGQGGLGDVQLHPDFARNGLIYLSYVEAGDDDTRGAVVIRATLDMNGLALTDITRIWTQSPKVTGRGHYGHRLLFDEDGYLFISSGDRQKFTPAQDMQQNLGKIIRLHDDGRVPEDNPFVDQAGVAAEVWSLGQRNPLGIAFAEDGQLWEIEMGPAGGDELNLITRGENYGYPIVSNGDHYSGKEIPDHDTRPEFAEPEIWWTPVISPGGMIIYRGALFESWRGNALVAGLSSESLVRIGLEGTPSELERYNMGERIRGVAEGPEGAVYLLEDGEDGRLLKLVPLTQASG